MAVLVKLMGIMSTAGVVVVGVVVVVAIVVYLLKDWAGL
jgi:hypothetical protein